MVRADVRRAHRLRGAGDRVQPLAADRHTRRRRPPTPPHSPARCSCPRTSGNKAYTTAQTVATENGFTNGSGGVTVTTAPGLLPNQLKVTVAINTKNPWGAIVNYNNTTIVRSAVAEYQLPQNLGSPQNTYGNDPESAAAQPQFWGNVFGPSSTKDKGDAIQSVGPTANTTLCNADNCNGPAAAPVSGQNRDYDANGYFYGIDVPDGDRPGRLNVQVYDPGVRPRRRQLWWQRREREQQPQQRRDAHRGADPGLRHDVPDDHTGGALRLGGLQRVLQRRQLLRRRQQHRQPVDHVDAAGPRRLDLGSDQQPDRLPGRVPGRLPGDHERAAERHRRRHRVEDAAAAVDQLPRHEPGPHLRLVLPPVGARSAVSTARCRARTSSRCRRGRRSTAPRRPTAGARTGSRSEWALGSNFSTTQRAPRVRQPEDGCLRERHRREHAVLPHPGTAGRGGQDAGAELLRHRRRFATRDARPCSRPRTRT